MPRMFRLKHDNATGETKNQTVFKLMAHMVHDGIFDVAEAAQYRVGHSHNEQDQRFAVAATSVHRTRKILENIVDFGELLQKDVKPIAGLPHHDVEIMGGSYDWKAWFDILGVGVSGHTGTADKKKNRQTACHVYRFVRREDV